MQHPRSDCLFWLHSTQLLLQLQVPTLDHVVAACEHVYWGNQVWDDVNYLCKVTYAQADWTNWWCWENLDPVSGSRHVSTNMFRYEWTDTTEKKKRLLELCFKHLLAIWTFSFLYCKCSHYLLLVCIIHLSPLESKMLCGFYWTGILFTSPRPFFFPLQFCIKCNSSGTYRNDCALTFFFLVTFSDVFTRKTVSINCDNTDFPRVHPSVFCYPVLVPKLRLGDLGVCLVTKRFSSRLHSLVPPMWPGRPSALVWNTLSWLALVHSVQLWNLPHPHEEASQRDRTWLFMWVCE